MSPRSSCRCTIRTGTRAPAPRSSSGSSPRSSRRSSRPSRVEEIESTSSKARAVSRCGSWGIDLDEAAIELHPGSSRRSTAPEDVGRPRVSSSTSRASPSSSSILKLDPVALTEIVEDQVRFRFARIPGVAQGVRLSTRGTSRAGSGRVGARDPRRVRRTTCRTSARGKLDDRWADARRQYDRRRDPRSGGAQAGRDKATIGRVARRHPSVSTGTCA